jgi:basic membrane protein A
MFAYKAHTKLMKRRDFITTAGAGIVFTGLAGCGGDGDDTDTPSEGGNGNGDMTDTDTDMTGTGTPEPLELAIISGVGGFGDNAFNDLAVQGLQSAVDEHGGNLNQVEGEEGNFESVQRQLASGDTDYDLIVCVSNAHGPALEITADEFPDQNWMIINQGLFREDGSHYENVAGYVWANHEMSFQAGVAAGTMTSESLSYDGNSNDPDSKTVGFVGGVDNTLIQAFEEAYIAGVEYVDSDVEVLTGYAGSFADPAAGQETAGSQYENGADIVYHASAGTGPGIFDAAQANNAFAIGVDAEQSVTLPDYSDVIMGSAVKRINAGTKQVADAVANDNFSDVAGKETVAGLEEDAVEFVKGADIGSELPDVLDTNLQDAKDDIINGNVSVPCAADGC